MKQGIFRLFGLQLTTLMVSLVVGGFFYVGGVAAQSPRPDLKITTATFDGGKGLHVEYINATGVAYPKMRYEVGFQWYDATGKSVGVRRWFPVPGVERGGVTIFDPTYQRIELSYRARDGRILGEQLFSFLRGRPDAATELRVTVDDGDRISETDERNNVAVLPFAPPDLQIQNARLLPGNRLQFEFQNAKPATIANAFQIGFTWVDDAGKTLAVTRQLSALATLPGVQKIDSANKTFTGVSFLYESGRQGMEPLQWYLDRRPAQATQLKISMDDTRVVTESNEQNNIVLLRVALPDLVVRDAKFVDRKLSFVYGNIGDGRISDSATRLLFQWRDLAGKPAGEPRWYRFAQMDAKQMIPVNPERFNVEYAVSGTRRVATERLATYVSQRPHNATHMSIVIDDEQRIVEANETNNGENVTPPPLPLPDLALATASFVSPTRLSVSYQNLSGTPVTGSVRMGFVWANENGNPLTFSRWMNVPAPAVNAVETIDVSRTDVSYTDAQGRRIGDRLDIYLEQRPVEAMRFIVTIDDDSAIRESNEQNNSVRLRPSLPDLEMVEAVWNEQGLAVTFRNASDAAVGAPFLWFHFADARGTQAGRIAWWDGPPIAGGSVQTIRSRDLTFGSERGLLSADEFLDERPRGASHVKILVDGPARISESNELNNTALVAIPSKALPDLSIADIAWTRDGLSFATRNSGTGVARGVGNKPLSYWFEWVGARGTRVGPVHWMDTMEAMEPGSEARLTPDAFAARILVRDGDRVEIGGAAFLAVPPAQATHLKVTADGPSVIRESNESNNSANVKRPRPPQPDLTVTELSVKQAVITWTEKNGGDALDAGGAYTTRLEWVAADGTVLGTYEEDTAASEGTFKTGVLKHGELSGLKNTPLTFRIAPAGVVKLRATIDVKNVISESSEQNNVMEVNAPRPDLTFTKIYAPKGYRWLSISYKNEATDVAAPAFPWSMAWVDGAGRRVGAAFQGMTQPLVGWGESAISAEADTPAGKWLAQPKPVGAARLEFVLDPENKIGETNETNNKATFEGWVPESSIARYDFVIESAEIVGDDGMKILIQNAGELKLTQPLSVWFEWVDERDQRIGDLYWFDEKFNKDMPLSSRQPWTLQLERGYLPVLWSDRGAKRLKDFLADVPEKAKHLKIRLDGPNTFAEHDEANNVRRVPAPEPLRVALLDLALTGGSRAGGVVKLTIVNNTPDALVAPRLQFKWLDANGAALGTSPVSDWSGTNIAAGKTGEFKIEYERWREDGVTRFLKRPSTGAVALLATIDPENKLKESDEDNNTFRIEISGQPDLVSGGDSSVRNGALIVPVKNAGTAVSVATDAWIQWTGGGKWLEGVGGFDIPALQPGETKEISVPLDTTFRADGRILMDIPATAERLRVFLDGARKIEESNEDNNSVMLQRSLFPKAVVAKETIPLPDAAFTSVMVPRNDDFLVIGFQNAGKADLGTWEWQIQWQDANGRTLGDTYRHRHSGLKPGWRFGLGSDMKEKDVTGTKTLNEFLKNIPKGAVRIEITLDPENKTKESNEENNEKRFEVANFPPSLTKKPEQKPEPKPEPKAEITPTGGPDLTIDGVGLLSDDLVTAANAPYTADFFGTVKNTGAVQAPAAHARLRLDVGNDGTWDITLPTSSALDVIPADDYTTAQWRVTWRAPLGVYGFEICVDHENKIKEENEKNNCQTDQFTFVVGQEPIFEEG